MPEETENKTPELTTSFDGEHLEPILENPVPGHIPVLRQLGVALLFLVIVFGTTYAGSLVARVSPEVEDPDVIVRARLIESDTEVFTLNPLESVDVEARAAIVWDVRDQKVLFDKNADQVLPLASVTKLMTALVAYELLDDSSKINISVDAIRTDGDSGLKDGEVFSLRNITDMVLMASSNDGATALALAAGDAVGGVTDTEAIFLEAMNLRARELGLTQTVFKNVTGLDISPTEAGAYSTAQDVSKLLEYIITTYPEVTSLTTESSTRVFNNDGEYHDVENTNKIVNRIEGLIASKTGYTELAGGNLAVAFESGLNRPIVVVVLGSSFDGRFTDVLTLSEQAQAYVRNQAKY
jgi:serine-type D-Ala-D-Ala carboxypeptidase (penicillin-binding protein 5/6)